MVAAAVLVCGLAHGRAEAQVFVGATPYGISFGWGNTQADELTNRLAQQSLAQGAAASARRNEAMAAVDNSNAYYNHVRDPAYTGRYDVSTRRRVEEEPARRPGSPSRETANPDANAKPTPAPARPLTDYFDRSGLLVWPADAPADGDLRDKRDASNRASLAVLVETRQQGPARVATVTEARTKLLDYGRPALELLRGRATPAVSELFHAFLLGLYDSLGRASSPPPAPRP